ncbi:MAG: hypothetical protein GQ564_18235 [Bacteroidales bacterium]|nr:hypothetical protein [Bacteroidales bacterium]
MQNGLLLARTDNQQSIWVEQDANARTRGYFESRMGSTELSNFDAAYPNQQYFDSRYFRNYLFPEFSLLYLFDRICPN